ncbi:D-Ala-D-Ala carboxypeptidase family metallohydrolase [uncultured Paraglaciecola sp.]|mgnify:CR=1 FL=1|uniref:D-Ala-D-Ala carboxypeptidase family metallohydrolase n=1 Tax=uncultured Paraglaciecola sp. TaxID=1765024 RepID=UPI0026060017|nr:D-Ala-D-Ala carboxypeptidase family metallohydrolase [uncultured Paraglaciecola sp.]
MKTTTGKGIAGVIGAWLLVKAQEFIEYVGSVEVIDWSVVGSTAVSELTAGAIALVALFVNLEPAKPAQKPYKRLNPEIDNEPLDTFDTPVRADVGQNTVTTLKPTKNWFSDAELDCKCPDLAGCDYRGMHQTVMAMVNDLRERFGPLVVTSGYRCPQHNVNVGGSSDSYHVKGMAIDLKSPTVSAVELYRYMDNKYPRQYGLGLYKTFIHVDCRSGIWARKTGPDKSWRQFSMDAADVALA